MNASAASDFDPGAPSGSTFRQQSRFINNEVTLPNMSASPQINRVTREMRGLEKTSRIPVKVTPSVGPMPRKPPWIRVKAPIGPAVQRLKSVLRAQRLHTVCEEASCPNIGECFSHGTATFMIMGDICTRRCPFCDVAHGRPAPLDPVSRNVSRRPSKGWNSRMSSSLPLIATICATEERGTLWIAFVHCANAARSCASRSWFRTFAVAWSGARRTCRGATGRLQPQPRDGAASLPEGASGGRLPVVARPHSQVQGGTFAGSDQVGSDARAR